MEGISNTHRGVGMSNNITGAANGITIENRT